MFAAAVSGIGAMLFRDQAPKAHITLTGATQ
jgi:hypothetical protein